MAIYKEFTFENLAASTNTAAFKLFENTELGITGTVADPTTFDADVFIQLSLKREEPSADTDWFTLDIAGATPGDPLLTLTTAGTVGQTGFGAIAKWARVKITRNAGSADVVIRVLGLGGKQ